MHINKERLPNKFHGRANNGIYSGIENGLHRINLLQSRSVVTTNHVYLMNIISQWGGWVENTTLYVTQQ